MNGLFPRGANVDLPRSHPFLPAGAAVVADAIDIKPKAGRIRISPVASPLQCPAIDYCDVTRVFVYFNHGSDVPVLERYRMKNIPAMPMVTIEYDICRDDLLFEIEVGAFSIPAENV